jgi:hypothetical protein
MVMNSLVDLAEPSCLRLFEGLAQAVELLRNLFVSSGKAAAFFNQLAHGPGQTIDFFLLRIVHSSAPFVHPLFLSQEGLSPIPPLPSGSI